MHEQPTLPPALLEPLPAEMRERAMRAFAAMDADARPAFLASLETLSAQLADVTARQRGIVDEMEKMADSWERRAGWSNANAHASRVEPPADHP